MTNGKVNVAIVGLGFGAEFIPIYQRHPNANMYGICQRTKSKLDQVGDAFGIGKRYTEFADVLKDPEVDFVHINSPIPDHAWMSIKALQAGKHVACTVPMGTSIDECRQIVESQKKSGKTYMMMETAKGQMPMPARRPACAGSRLNSLAQVLIRNMRVMNPKLVVTRATKQPQNSTLSCLS